MHYCVFVPGRGALTRDRGVDCVGPIAVWKTVKGASRAMGDLQDSPSARMPRNVEAFKAATVMPLTEAEALCVQIEKAQRQLDNRCRQLKADVDGAAQAYRMAPFTLERGGVSRLITKEEAQEAFDRAQRELTLAINEDPAVKAWFLNG